MIKMGNMTLSFPDDVLKKMKKYKEIKWSEVARQKIIEYLTSLELLEKISSLDESKAIDLGLSIHHQSTNEVWEKWKKENLKN